MGRKGRPQKPGKRKSGRPVVDRSFDRGSEWVQRQRDRYGEHYGSAIGRAYAAGLLGDGSQAKDRFDAAKRFSRAYMRIISQDRYRCALDRTPRGNLAIDLSPEANAFELEEQAWLFEAMNTLDQTGTRPFFDQLISSLHADKGPYWLDALLGGGRHPADRMVLDAALKAIDAITPRRAVGVIRVVRT